MIRQSFSLFQGTASLDPRSNGRISAVCLGYIMLTNCVPAVVGTIVCLIVKPGKTINAFIHLNWPCISSETIPSLYPVYVDVRCMAVKIDLQT